MADSSAPPQQRENEMELSTLEVYQLLWKRIESLKPCKRHHGTRDQMLNLLGQLMARSGGMLVDAHRMCCQGCAAAEPHSERPLPSAD